MLTTYQTTPQATYTYYMHTWGKNLPMANQPCRCNSCNRKIGSMPYATSETLVGTVRVCEDCLTDYAEHEGISVKDIDNEACELVKCNICGHVHLAEDATEASDGTWICDGCVEDGSAEEAGYIQCDKCGELMRHDDAVEVHTDYWGDTTEMWCHDCVDAHAHKCEDCGEYYDGDRITEYYIHHEGYIYLCDSCTDEYTTCCGCGDLVHNDDICCDDYGDCYCEDCYRQKRESSKLKEYHHTYAEKFFSAGTDDVGARIRLYLGVELETIAGDGEPELLAEDISDAVGDDRVECKEDSSLGDDGCEIVTQPMTPVYHLTTSLWPDIISACHSHDATSHDNGKCGLHIHIDRSALTHAHGYSAAYCIDRIMRLHRDEWSCFSRRRTLGDWCQIDSVRPDTSRSCADKYADWTEEYHGRYRAINLTNNATIEWRLNRGSLRLTTIRACIEMAAGLALAANSIVLNGIDPDTLSWDDFIRRVRAQLEMHHIPEADLNAYLQERGLAPTTTTA